MDMVEEDIDEVVMVEDGVMVVGVMDGGIQVIIWMLHPFMLKTIIHGIGDGLVGIDDDNNGHQWTHHGSYAHQVSTESAPCSLLVCGGGRRRHVSEAGFVQGWERQLFYAAVVPWWVLEAQLELGVCTGGGGVGGVVRARWVLIWLIVNSIGALDTSCLGASTPRCGNTAPHGPQPYTPGNNMPRPPGSQPCPPGNNLPRHPGSQPSPPRT